MNKSVSKRISGSLQRLRWPPQSWLPQSWLPQSWLPQPIVRSLSAALLLIGALWMVRYGDFLRHAEAIPQFWLGAAVMGAGYVLSWQMGNIGARWFWVVAVLTRLLLLGMAPNSDIWRYLWEGYLQTQGISPYAFAPNAWELVNLRPEWWSQINHPDVSAIYPPMTQFGFRVLAMMTPAIWLFKLAFVAADLGICGVLSRYTGYGATLLYAWNPLVIYSFASGGHYDSWFLLPLVAAGVLLMSAKTSTGEPLINQKPFEAPPARCIRPLNPPSLEDFELQNPPDLGSKGAAQNVFKVIGRSPTFTPTPHPWRWLISAALVGISIAVKWISLPVLAFLVWRSLRRFGPVLAVGVLLSGLMPIGLSALPFCSPTACPLVPTDSGFVAYGRSAELIPFLVEQVWPASRWENWLFAFPLTLAVVWLLLRAQTFWQFAEWYLLALLTLSPIIHAWYFAWLMPFAVISRNWGSRLMGLSAFVYFVLPYRSVLGDGSWYLSPLERWGLWLPFGLGLLAFLGWRDTQRPALESYPYQGFKRPDS
ncbi:MAG: hypothetical protein AAF215_13495 [Cyanobacteria bacterium P01_A01_bin.123]